MGWIIPHQERMISLSLALTYESGGPKRLAFQNTNQLVINNQAILVDNYVKCINQDFIYATW